MGYNPTGMELRTGENDSGRRLDRVLRKALQNHPLPLLYRLLRQGLVLVNGKPAKAQDRVTAGALISIPSLENRVSSPAPPPAGRLQKPPDILWQGSGLLAVNKPSGLSVHGPDSLDTIVRSYLADTLPASLSFKPGPLHRLDKPTSGVIVFSTSIEGARNFSRLMLEQKILKTYLALVEGRIEKEEIWQDELVRDKNLKKTFVAAPLSGGEKNNAKAALTRVRPCAANGSYTLVTAEISTGRTHQIRAQAGAHGHPLAGDRKYGGHVLHTGQDRTGFFLHAWKLELPDISIEAPLPPAFRKLIAAMFDSEPSAVLQTLHS